MKLWQKNNNNLNAFIESFETKDDLIWDQKLLPYDIQGSLAHAKMLGKIGILTQKEVQTLEKGFLEIKKLDEHKKFNLEIGDEDIHTKIENYLTEKYGDIGKKIHTGRSRNDQILTAIRLYTKAEIEKLQTIIVELIQTLQVFNKQYGSLPMPGYTHMQKAMPSSIGLWTENFIASFEDDKKTLDFSYELIDQSPLGSAAGFGLPIQLDKAYTAKLLNFAKVQENPIYCQQSRGKFEAQLLSSLIQIMQTINKLSSDVMLFTMQEFDFFTVSETITTGSSIMPQKKNVDLAELLRSKVHVVLGNYTQIVSLNSNLISGFNRDLQDSKKPLMESLEITLNSIQATKILVENIQPNKTKLQNAMTDDLYATEKTLKLVLKGENFRDAYQKIGKAYAKGEETYDK